MSLNKEWILVFLICSAPFLLFGATEMAGMLRQRRFEAVARRSKSRPSEKPKTRRV
jgi:hypothetical protein